MTQSTPHPPHTLATKQMPFGFNLGIDRLFQVKQGVAIDEALTLASEYLTCAAATAYEAADNAQLEFRPLGRAAVHQIEIAKALVDAALTGLSTNSSRSAT